MAKKKRRLSWALAYDTESTPPKSGKVEPVTFDLPSDFVLIVDTREQVPLVLRPPKGLLVVRATLRAGGYSVRGFENSIAIERKSLPDFYHSIGQDRVRFQKELATLSAYEYRALTIEGSETDILSWQEFSRMHPNSVRQTIVSIEVRLKIPVWFGSRFHMERWILDRLIKFYNIKRQGGGA